MEAFAVISDVHGNLEALEAVLADICRREIGRIACLGDVVGYGPDPEACIDLVRERCEVCIRGNHDEAVLKGAFGFNTAARDAVDWTRRRLRPRLWRPASYARWSFLSRLPALERWRGCLLVHGSPRDPTSEYLLPHEVAWPPPGKFEEVFSAFETICFVGHTHVPGVFAEGPRFTPQHDIDGPFRRGDSKLVINVGSVGQPRDRDPRACYVSSVDGELEFHRVSYPVERTQAKIRALPALAERLAERLERGD